MIVCVCKRVSDRDIAHRAHAGMGFEGIQLELGVATQCGRCESCARDVVAQCHAHHPHAALQQVSPLMDARHGADVSAGRPVFSHPAA